MTRLVAAGPAAVAWVASAQRPQPAPLAGELVELDVVALDRHDRPVHLLGYWPSEWTRDLHAIDVKVACTGIHVRASQRR